MPGWGTTVITPANLDQLANFARLTNVQVELAVDIGHLDANAIASEAHYAATTFGSHLQASECGNEPNDFSHNDIRDGSYDYATYRADFTACANAIASAAPIAGPDTRGVYIPQFAPDEHNRVALITQHAYAINNCDNVPGSIATLLSATTVSSEISKSTPTLAAARAQGLPLRLDETNSANCGGITGVSNTYAASLWAVDYSLLMASQGIAGLNFHGSLGSACTGYTPLCLTSATNNTYAPMPIYYGMLFANLLGPGQMLPVTVATTQNVTAYAVRGQDGRLRVMLVEKNATGIAGKVTLHVGGGSGVGQVRYLTGPALNSTSGIAIQGQSVDAAGHFTAGATTPVTGLNGSYTLALQTGSAALVTLP